MKFVDCLVYTLLFTVIVACESSYVVPDVKTKYVTAENTVAITRDTTFCSCFSEVRSCVDVQVVCDTLLVIKDQVGNSDDCRFKIYSTGDFEYLGAIIRKGRGPGELVAPYVVKSFSSSKYLSLNDRPTGCSYMVDIQASIASGVTVIVQRTAIPEDVIDWIPLSGTANFALQQVGSRIAYNIIYDNGQSESICELNESIDANRHVTIMSSVCVNDVSTQKSAVVMMFFPQINIVDIKSGKIRSVAVGKDIRKFDLILNQRLTPHTKQYYIDAISTKSHIIATYKNLPLNKLNDVNVGTEIHVFDWTGRFVLNIIVAENIAEITFDEKNKYLYGIDSSNGDIVRYDLKALI